MLQLRIQMIYEATSADVSDMVMKITGIKVELGKVRTDMAKQIEQIEYVIVER